VGRHAGAALDVSAGRADPCAAVIAFTLWSVPRRTTPFQMIIHLLRRQTAAPGVTVTESRELTDARLGIGREVDVVVEGNFDGERVVTSIEVIEHGRPASITWVEQQIGKHRSLPTNRLVLVSKSGFSRTPSQRYRRRAAGSKQ